MIRPPRNDDAFLAGPAIGLGIAVGGVGGGLIGAIAFGVTHASNANSAASWNNARFAP